MFNTTSEPSDLDKALDYAHQHLASHSPETPEYADICDQIVKLHTLKTNESKGGIDANTWATIAANLLGIGMVLHYEKFGIVTSKALGFISKLK